MNKVSGKLAAGVRKIKTQPTPPAAVEKTPAAPGAPRRAPAESRAAPSDLHPARIWPD